MTEIKKINLAPFYKKRPWLVRPAGLLFIVFFPIFIIILSLLQLKELFKCAIEMLTWDGK